MDIKHALNGREYRLPELPHFNVDGYCAETNTVYEYYGCHWHGHACHPFRDVTTTNGDTLAAIPEQTMARLQQITRAGYEVKVQWECEFDDAGIETPELLAHPALCQGPLCTRDALYGGRTYTMRLHYKAREGKNNHYVDVIILYPYICKYLKFPLGHSIFHVGDAYKDKESRLGMDGLIKCSIVPPERLYHPVLPF